NFLLQERNLGNGCTFPPGTPSDDGGTSLLLRQRVRDQDNPSHFPKRIIMTERGTTTRTLNPHSRIESNQRLPLRISARAGRTPQTQPTKNAVSAPPRGSNRSEAR